MNRHILLCLFICVYTYKVDSKDQLVWHRKLNQYFVITYKCKESKKKIKEGALTKKAQGCLLYHTTKTINDLNVHQ